MGDQMFQVDSEDNKNTAEKIKKYTTELPNTKLGPVGRNISFGENLNAKIFLESTGAGHGIGAVAEKSLKTVKGSKIDMTLESGPNHTGTALGLFSGEDMNLNGHINVTIGKAENTMKRDPAEKEENVASSSSERTPADGQSSSKSSISSHTMVNTKTQDPVADVGQGLADFLAKNRNFSGANVAKRVHIFGKQKSNVVLAGDSNVVLNSGTNVVYHKDSITQTNFKRNENATGTVLESWATGQVVRKDESNFDQDSDNDQANIKKRRLDPIGEEGGPSSSNQTYWVQSTGLNSSNPSVSTENSNVTSENENAQSIFQPYIPSPTDSGPLTTEISSECIRNAAIKLQQGYPTSKANYRGIAVIINVINFPNDNQIRHGAEKDTENLAKVLHQRNFQVRILNDPTENMLKTAIEEIKTWKFENADSLLLAVMSHGDGVNISTSNGQNFPILNGIVNQLNNQHGGGGLRGKPKIFLFNCCRGKKDDKGVGLDHDAMPEQFDHLTIPSWTDVLICYSSLGGHYSYRDRKEGSWFIQTFCAVLRKYGDTCDIIGVLNIVSEVMKSVVGTLEVEGEKNKGEKETVKVKQICPHYNIGFTKKFYL